MDHVRCPSELLDCLEDTPCEEYGSFAVVLEEFSVFVKIYLFSVEIVLVINEVHLHSGSRNGCNLDYKRSVHIIDDDVHSRETDDLMKLVLSFVDAAIARHEGSDFLLSFLNSLRKVSSYVGYRRLREIWIYLRVDEQYPFDRISHTGGF